MDLHEACPEAVRAMEIVGPCPVWHGERFLAHQGQIVQAYDTTDGAMRSPISDMPHCRSILTMHFWRWCVAQGDDVGLGMDIIVGGRAIVATTGYGYGSLARGPDPLTAMARLVIKIHEAGQ